MVIAFSQEKLPLRTSQAWVRMMIAAATLLSGWGRKRPKGTTSWAT